VIADIVDHYERSLMVKWSLFKIMRSLMQRLQSRSAGLAQAMAATARHAGLVDRLLTRMGEGPPKDLDGSTKPEYDKMTGQVFAQFRRHDLDPHHVRA